MEFVAQPMQDEIAIAVRNIGCQLDSFSFPAVKNGGIVVSGASAVFPSNSGKEFNDGIRKERCTGTQHASRGTPRQRSSAETWPSGGPWPLGETASLLISSFRAQYEAELSSVEVAYPGTQFWTSDDGLWLLVESGLLPGLFPKTFFVVGINFANRNVQGWGFQGSSAIGYEWIGPRHTNFPDGSICAFDQQDGTWSFGDTLVELLDLYTLWVLRHLHLKMFDRWPGMQSIPYVYERILELRDDEYCGCANSQTLYKDCCKDSDRRRSVIKEALHFMRATMGGLRKPPQKIIEFLLKRGEPPPIALLTNLFE
jgi:hypothetical protein